MKTIRWIILPALMLACFSLGTSGGIPPVDAGPQSFRVHYPALVAMPPVASGMPADIREAYLGIDSFLRSAVSADMMRKMASGSADASVINHLTHDLYTVVDYNPGLFIQYADGVELQRGARYVTSLHYLTRTLSDLRRDASAHHGNALYSLLYSDYILHVRVISIDSIVDPRDAEYNQYRVTAEVLDTVKGHTFRAGGASRIQFQYVPGNYPDTAAGSIDRDEMEFPYKLTDPEFTSPHGRFMMRPGQEAVVFLKHSDHILIQGDDTYTLHLEPFASFNAMPVIDGELRDINHVWNDRTSIQYAEWRSRVTTLRGELLGR
ncbi:MAG: hypothetical protein JWQ98_3139 [Chlorobi bacterium]|nr:hypothetical protein [Chlorobiota bacterium]